MQSHRVSLARAGKIPEETACFPVSLVSTLQRQPAMHHIAYGEKAALHACVGVLCKK